MQSIAEPAQNLDLNGCHERCPGPGRCRSRVLVETAVSAVQRAKQALAALRPPHLRLFKFPPEGRVSLARRNHPRPVQKPRIRRLIKNLPKRSHESSPARNHPPHPRSSTIRVLTNGDSFIRASLVPRRIPHHCRADSNSTSVTITTRIPVIAASSRLLKMSRAVAPVDGPSANTRACARNPTRGFASNILYHDAVNVTTTSQARGTSVTAA